VLENRGEVANKLKAIGGFDCREVTCDISAGILHDVRGIDFATKVFIEISVSHRFQQGTVNLDQFLNRGVVALGE
jgi:hypothetical protein